MYEVNETEQLAVFKLDSHFFGIDINKINEMVEIEDLKTTPMISKYFVGIIEIRDNVVPVLDLRKRFHLPTIADNRDNRILVIHFENFEFGIKIDSLTGLLKIRKSEISPIDYLFIGEHLEHLDGVVKLKDKHILLMDISTILNETDKSMILQIDCQKVLC